MASTIFSKLSQGMTAQETTTANQMGTGTVNNLANQILGSVNPQETFNQLLASNKDAQNAMNLINQYGNGDPKAAFMNYMQSQGKQNIGAQIMKRFGLR